MSRLVEVIILVNIVSGVLLAPLVYLSYTTGFCMKNPSVARIVTYGLIGDLSVCGFLHTVVLPIALLFAASAHGVSTAITLYLRLSSSRYARLVAHAYLAVVFLAIAQGLLLLIYASQP